MFVCNFAIVSDLTKYLKAGSGALSGGDVCNFVSCHSLKCNKISKSRKPSSRHRGRDVRQHRLGKECRTRPGAVVRLEGARVPHAQRGQGEMGISL